LKVSSQARKRSRIALPELCPPTVPLPDTDHRVMRRGRLFGLLLNPEGIVRGFVANRTQHRSENGKEVGGLTVTIDHPTPEDLSLEEVTELLLPDLSVEEALYEARGRTAPDLYEVPIAEVEHVERETESYLAWVIVLGFVAYALALYWADKCNRRGGDPVIRYTLLRGFIVKCYK
jgi:hypothetical protein